MAEEKSAKGKTLFEFANIVVPPFYEVADKHQGYYLLGKNNKYYDYLSYLYKNAPNHASIINNQVQRIIGTGFQSQDPIQQELIDKYRLNEWLGGVAKDEVLFGGYATEVIWNKLHTNINAIYKVNTDRVRVGLMDEEQEESQLYYYSSLWSDYKYLSLIPDVEVLHTFDPDPVSDPHQLLYQYGVNRVGSDVYPRPDYSTALPWCETDLAIPKYYMNLIHNNFMVSNILVCPYQPDPAVREEFEKGLKEKFAGVENAATTMVVYVPEGGTEPKLINVAGEQGEHKYGDLMELCVASLARVHGLPSPMLAGLSLPGNLFGIADLPAIENQYNKQVIHPKRRLILNDFNKLNKYFKVPLTDFTIDDDNVFNEKTN